MKLHRKLRSILEPAYPCENLSKTKTCGAKGMVWDPESGHIPRGFLGATGKLKEVKLILVFAEPGDPGPNERYRPDDKLWDSAFDAARRGHENAAGAFHQNVQTILRKALETSVFKKQMRRVWMTESVLCSAKKTTGHVPADVARACGERYLKAQISAMPHAMVVALGKKAAKRLKDLDIECVEVAAAAPPGANRKEAEESWKKIPKNLRKWKKQHAAVQCQSARPQ